MRVCACVCMHSKERKREGVKEGEGLKKFLKLKLIIGELHPNPGPVEKENYLTLVTYNCRGWKDIVKLRRLMGKINKLVEQNYIVALQETHKVEDRILQLYCKHNFVKNCEQENRAGVMINYVRLMLILTKALFLLKIKSSLTS
jgi:hypothetical protein